MEFVLASTVVTPNLSLLLLILGMRLEAEQAPLEN